MEQEPQDLTVLYIDLFLLCLKNKVLMVRDIEKKTIRHDATANDIYARTSQPLTD